MPFTIVPVGEPLPKQVLDTAVDPDVIPNQTFNVGRRGYDQAHVQEYLQAVAASLHDAQQREAEMRTRVAKAIRRAEKAEKALRERPDAEGVDHRQLGDDVASVLDAAHAAAAQRTTTADIDAEATLAAAQAAAEERRVAAETEAADIVGDGRTEADAVRAQARSDADEMLRSAAARIEQTRDECDGLIREAEEARAQILEDMERRRRQARAQVERLRVGRDRLLRSYDVVRRTLDETTGDLKSSLKEAKVRGDSAARSIIAEPMANRDQLEAELADAKLIGRIKISDPETSSLNAAALRSAALPRPLDPPRSESSETSTQVSEDSADAAADPARAPTPRKPALAESDEATGKSGKGKSSANKAGASRSRVPAQPKAPATAPVLSATPVPDDDKSPAQIDAELAELEDHNLNVVLPADEIEEVTALPAPDTGNELFALLRIQSSKDKRSPADRSLNKAESNQTEVKKTTSKANVDAKQSGAKKTAGQKAKSKKGAADANKTEGKASDQETEIVSEDPSTLDANKPVVGLNTPGLDAQRDAVIADAAKQLEKRLKRALADEQNDLLATIRSVKKRKTITLAAVVGDLETHISRYVVAINEVAAVTYGAGAALVDAEPAAGHMPAGAVEELLEADVVLPIREHLASLDALEVKAVDDHVDPVRSFYRERKTDHLGFAASRLAQLLCVAGLHDAQS